MSSPGDGLRQEREARGKTIEEMAEATGIRPHLLAALEQEAFDSLPGRGFGKLYIRAYAEVLGFDPRPVIEAYDQAVLGRRAAASGPAPPSAPRPVKAMLARWRLERMAARAEAGAQEVETQLVAEAPGIIAGAAEVEPEPAAVEPAPAVEPETAAAEQETAPAVMAEPAAGELIEDVSALPLLDAVSPSRSARSGWWLVAALLLVVLLPLIGWRVFLRSPRDVSPVPTRNEPAPKETIAPPAQTPVREPTSASSLRVAESGVGLRLVGTRLEGEGDHFQAGQRVTFATRVLGGGAGESIRHVWLRNGKVEQSIRLSLGGASWRTHSTKTLGRPGAWTVEARDDQGRVLARVDLTVVP